MDSQQQPFYTVLAHMGVMYGITMQEDQFENIAFHAWEHIGNKNSMLYTYHGSVHDNRLELPPNVDIVEGVFSSMVDFRMKDNVNRWDYTNLLVENFVKWSLRNREVFDSYGSMLPYEREGNILHFKDLRDISVHVLYKGVIVDDTGLPYLNFKEVDAIAKYCAWVDKQRKAFMTNDKATMEVSQMLHQQWQVACDDARTPILLNQNDMDRILNVSSSWDRKRFGLSFKPIR